MILLFPFGLTADQITFWGGVAVVVTVLLTLWSSIASTLAAKYAKGAPSKEDFNRLEDQVVSTSEYLRRQRRREELSPKANRVSISIFGRNPIDELLVTAIVVREPTVKLTHVELRNEAGESGYVYATSEAFQIDARTYNAPIDSGNLRRLHESGVRNACMRVFMVIEQEEVNRDVPVTLANVPMRIDQQDPKSTVNSWVIQGEV